MTKSMKATNQNLGATIRINTKATARCIRQWTNRGKAHPFFWSLPWAIQAFCSTKSAMMCLKVKSSIQPTNRPTGIDDDMGGNDKLTTSQNLGPHGDQRRSALLVLNQPIRPPYRALMTSLRPDCTCR